MSRLLTITLLFLICVISYRACTPDDLTDQSSLITPSSEPVIVASIPVPTVPDPLPVITEPEPALPEPVMIEPDPLPLPVPPVVVDIKPIVPVVPTVPPPKPVVQVSIKPSNTKAYIPPAAFQYFDIIKKEQHRVLPDFPYPHYFAGLIEHESCLSLTHSRCWNPKSQLKSQRELGLGLGQITKTFNADGSIRFDTLSDLRRAHMAELKELSWSNVTQRPDLQIRAIIIMTRTNYKALYTVTNPYERLAMADAAYNGGLGGLRKERRTCGLAAGCDPQYWFGHIEKQCLKSKKILYANRNACDINRGHVIDTLKTRMPKYQPHFS